MSSRLTTSEYQDITVAEIPLRSVLDAVLVDSIGHELYALVERDKRLRIVVDLHHVRSLSSSMMGVFLTLHKKAQAAGGKVVLCGAQQEVSRMFDIANLKRILPLAPDGPSAVRVLEED